MVDPAASGVPAETIAPKIRERQTARAKVEAQLGIPRQTPPNIEQLRAALEQRAAEWKAQLRTEPEVARLLLRRILGPITPWDPEDQSGFMEWEATVTADLLEGLVQLVTSPTGTADMFRRQGQRHQQVVCIHTRNKGRAE